MLRQFRLEVDQLGKSKQVTFTTELEGCEGLCKQRCENRVRGSWASKEWVCSGSWSTGTWQRIVENKSQKPGWGKTIEGLQVDKKYVSLDRKNNLFCWVPKIVHQSSRKHWFLLECKHAMILSTAQKGRKEIPMTLHFSPPLLISNPLFCKTHWQNCWHPVFS